MLIHDSRRQTDIVQPSVGSPDYPIIMTLCSVIHFEEAVGTAITVIRRNSVIYIDKSTTARETRERRSILPTKLT